MVCQDGLGLAGSHRHLKNVAHVASSRAVQATPLNNVTVTVSASVKEARQLVDAIQATRLQTTMHHVDVHHRYNTVLSMYNPSQQAGASV